MGDYSVLSSHCGGPRAVSGPVGSWRLLTSAVTGRQQIARAVVDGGRWVLVELESRPAGCRHADCMASTPANAIMSALSVCTV